MYLTYYIHLVGIKRSDRRWHLSHVIFLVHHSYSYDHTGYTNFSNFYRTL